MLQLVVLIVTDGEPTAHLEDFDGRGSWCSSITRPIHRDHRAHRPRSRRDRPVGRQVTIFRLGDDPGLTCFIDQVARRVEGRAVVPDLDRLGAAVVGDYLRPADLCADPTQTIASARGPGKPTVPALTPGEPPDPAPDGHRPMGSAPGLWVAP